jgi:hypothetical protein
MDTHYIGATPYLHINIVDEDGAAVAPTSVTVSIYDQNGTVMVEDAAMSSTATTGEYYYASWTVLSTHITGVYSWFPKSTDGTIVTRNKKFQFIVAREVGDNY